MNEIVFGIIGGYGRIGSEAAKSLLMITDNRIIIGGRNLEKGETAAKNLGPRVLNQVVDVNNPVSLDNFCQKCDILINCAGPSRIIFDKVALSALKNNIHYIDVGGYNSLYNNLSGKVEEIRQKGLTFIISAGMYPGLSEVFPVYMAKKYFDKVDLLEFYYAGLGDFSYSGSYDVICGIEEGHSQPLTYYDDGRIIKIKNDSSKTVVLPTPVGTVTCHLTFKEEILKVIEACNIKKAFFYNAFFGELTGKALYNIRDSVQYTTGTQKDLSAKQLVKASAEDTENHTSCNMMHLIMEGNKDGRHKKIISTIYEEDAHKLSGVVAASTSKLIKDGLVEGAGCFFLNEGVNVNKLMNLLHKQDISPSLPVFNEKPN